MDTDLLHTFEAICARGTTLAAARALGISQSAVSRRLAQLEAELGLTLFIRDKGRLIATQENRVLQGTIAAALALTTKVKSTAQELASGNSSAIQLRVAFPASLTMSIVPAILADFLKTHDRVLVEVQTGTYDAIERMLLEDVTDLGFLRIPTHRPGLTTTPLISVQTVCVMPKGHTLASKQTISLQDLAQEPLILLGKQRPPRNDIDRAFAMGLRPKVRIEAHSVMSACALVAQGLGITLVNALMARDFISLPIEIRPLDIALPHHFAFATSETSTSFNAISDFIDIAHARFRLITRNV